MNRRYRPNRRNNSHTLPVISLVLVLVALVLGMCWMWGGDVLRYFKGEVRTYADNSEANANLESLMRSLSGDKSKLLDLNENFDRRLGWVKDESVRNQFLWILMNRLIDKGLWKDAVRLLPKVEHLASEEGLDRLAEAALSHEDYELQLHLDDLLREKILDQPAYTEMLLRSLRRTAQTLIRMHRNDDVVRVISCLDRQNVQARLTDPKLAAEAAALQMMRADVCGAKDPVLQTVRNILENAKWPLCPATSQLMLEEVSSMLEENSKLSQNDLKEVERKLLRCRDSMLEYPDREHRLPKCYMLLGKLRYQMQDYEGCVQALTLAGAFAEGYGEMDSDMQVELSRLRSRANESRGNLADVAQDCHFLLAHDPKVDERFRALSLLARNASGAEKVQLYTQAWDMLQKEPKLAKSGLVDCPMIAKELAEYYKEKQDLDNATKWVEESVKLVKAAHPDMTDGVYFKARYDLALLYRRNKQDVAAQRILTQIARDIEAMDESSREALNNAAAAPKIYINTMRERARTCLLMGDKDSAKAICKKAKIDMPDKVR